MKFSFSMFKKAKKAPDFSLSSFQLLMDIVERSLSEKTEEEQLIVLDYVIDCLKIDICSSAVISPLIQQPSKPLAMPFPLEIFNIEKLYQHCYSDGEYWYNAHTKEKICKIDDFRLAAIFEIAKKRYFLKNKER